MTLNRAGRLFWLLPNPIFSVPELLAASPELARNRIAVNNTMKRIT